MAGLSRSKRNTDWKVDTMRLEFAHLRENIEACDATIAASQAVLGHMARCLEQFEVTHGSEIRQIYPTSEHTPKGLLCIATDGERADGRLAWVPGA